MVMMLTDTINKVKIWCMKDNILRSIGDVLIVNVVSETSGYIKITDHSIIWGGQLNTRTATKEFRIFTDEGFWSDWFELTNQNLTKNQFIVNGQFTIQLRFTRTGTDETGELEFKSIEFHGTRIDFQFVAPTLSSSMFANIIGTNELRQLEDNLFKKLYYRGILPDYIIRAENSDVKEDVDFIDVFYSVARFFAIIICFFTRFEKFKNDFDLMRENVRQYGSYFDESNTTSEELSYLSQHLLNEIQKRGTAMIFKRQGDIVNGQPLFIDGELVRLLRNKSSDELLYENVPLYQAGWCLGQCSPMYRGTSQSHFLNKTKENTEDFIDVKNFVITKNGKGKYELQTFNNRRVLQLFQTGSSNTVVGLGRVNADTEISIDDLIVVDSHLDYEITFAFQISKNKSNDNNLLFGVEGFDVFGNKLLDAFITPNGNQISETFVSESLSKWKRDNWYYAKGILHAYSSINMNESVTNLGFGTNLYFNNSFIKYILPKIQVKGTSTFNVKIWDYKVRPLIRGTNILPSKSGEENSHSLGFIQSQRLFYIYARNNNNNQSKNEITDIIEKYLLPYDTADIFVLMGNY